MGKDKDKQKSFRSRQQPASSRLNRFVIYIYWLLSIKCIISSQAASLFQPGEFIGFSSFSPILDLEQVDLI